MQRRGFLATLAAISAAAAMEVFGLERIAAAAPKAKKLIAVVNPAYIAAQYEDVVMFSEKTVMRSLRKAQEKPEPPKGFDQIIDQRPNRYNLRPDGRFEYVPLFIQVEVDETL